MPSIAIILGNANYDQQDKLECCLADVMAIKALIDATERYSVVHARTDVDGEMMRQIVREALKSEEKFEEIFFYFSGHGTQIEGEFFYCGTGFSEAKPNVTGLSYTALQDMFRTAAPELLVEVVDACRSGTYLVKAPLPPLPIKKEGFKNVIRLASCLTDQSSFGGDPLSDFTQKFLEACLLKPDGPVYYTEIIPALRDQYLANAEQTPFFVSQGTGHEVVVDDAKKLLPFREKYKSTWVARDDEKSGQNKPDEGASPPKPASLTDLLKQVEARAAEPNKAKKLIDGLFDGVISRIKQREFSEFFDIDVVEHADFREATAEDFVLRTLVRTPRPDNFVTAEIKRVRRKPNLWESAMFTVPEYDETSDLELNCKLDRAQMRLTLTPKYKSLQRLTLVLTCAPSLEQCYVFEVVTQHARDSWETFSRDGKGLVQRWYALKWDDDPAGLVGKISLALESAVQGYLDETAKRLGAVPQN